MYHFVGQCWRTTAGVSPLRPLCPGYGTQAGRLGALALSTKTILLTEVFETGSSFVVLESLAFNSLQSAILPPECWDYSHESLPRAQNVLLLFGSRG